MLFNRTFYLIQRAMVCIEALINQQLNIIMHHCKFQMLEASWRGLYYLAEQMAIENDKKTKLKVINITWTELAKDLTRAVEFDQSQLFTKVYNNEFGQPGGEPFGLLIGDYYISHRKPENNIVNDVIVLQEITKVAAAAFVPFITAAAPALFGLDDFTGLERPLDLERTFQQTEYQQWKNLRNDEDARFVGLVLPQVLLRVPYNELFSTNYPFRFVEKIINCHDYLWGNAGYCFAAVVVRAFVRSGWFTDIRGKRGSNMGGVVLGLLQHSFMTDKENIATKFATNVCITDQKEKILAEAGFIPLTESQYKNAVVFYACPSIQKLKVFDRKNVARNYQLSSMLHYILCVSRFAHYIKVIARDKLGTFATILDCETYLQNWLHQYTTTSSDLSDELKAKYPLRAAKVMVCESIGNPGKYLCTVHLCPHYQFEQIETYLQLTTELIN